jgi:hypothetical protein
VKSTAAPPPRRQLTPSGTLPWNCSLLALTGRWADRNATQR